MNEYTGALKVLRHLKMSESSLHYKMHWCEILKQVAFIAKNMHEHTLQTKHLTKKDIATVWNDKTLDLNNDIHTFISLTHLN